MIKFIVIALLLGVCMCRPYDKYDDQDEDDHGYEMEREEVKVERHDDDPDINLDVPGSSMPVHFDFESRASPVHVTQDHKNNKGSYHLSDSEDEPHVLVHEVIKPVIQEYRETIQPYRRITQIIHPVKEEVVTKIHKDSGTKEDESDEDNYDDE